MDSKRSLDECTLQKRFAFCQFYSQDLPGLQELILAMHHQDPFVLRRSYVCELQINTKKTVWVQSFLKFCTEALERSSIDSESTVFRRHLKTRLFLIWVLVSLAAALAEPLSPSIVFLFFYFRCTFLLFPVSFLTTLQCRAISPWYNRNG